uniref:Large ribosomal subunit protein mL51 n=1 Tax=Poecilia formosa TaxID=48698 RepID=A0A096LXI6_POEFO
MKKRLKMFALGGLLRVGSTFFHSAGNLLLPIRTISTGSCCQIRMHAIPQPKQVDRWNEKRSMFGVYDNIGILEEETTQPGSQSALRPRSASRSSSKRSASLGRAGRRKAPLGPEHPWIHLSAGL